MRRCCRGRAHDIGHAARPGLLAAQEPSQDRCAVTRRPASCVVAAVRENRWERASGLRLSNGSLDAKGGCCPVLSACPDQRRQLVGQCLRCLPAGCLGLSSRWAAKRVDHCEPSSAEQPHRYHRSPRLPHRSPMQSMSAALLNRAGGLCATARPGRGKAPARSIRCGLMPQHRDRAPGHLG